MPNLTRIRSTHKSSWENRHETFVQDISDLFDVMNGNTGSVLNDYNFTTKALQQFLQTAHDSNKTIRALGGGWSWSKVATTNGWMLNTKQLNMTLTNSSPKISNEYRGDFKKLIFAQCGNSVKELNDKLRKKNRSLKTSGASNGQTIVGAISTGTHGSAFDFGSTQDFIVGIHLIISPSNHVWIERESYPVVSDSFINDLQTKLIRDDELFNSALVSFGSFGFIHGVMVESEDLFLLECSRKKVKFDTDLKNTMATLDFSNLGFTERPFHFQVLINPYDADQNAYVTTMYKRSFKENYTPPVILTDVAGPGDDAPAFLGKLTDLVPALVPAAVNLLINSSYPPFNNVLGTLGEIFYNTDLRGKVTSTAVGIPLDRVNEVTEILFEINETSKFPGVFAYRYLKQSNATLAFSQFQPSCVVELDGSNSFLTNNFYELFWNRLESENIPYTFHWGKMNNLDSEKIKKMYGQKRDTWINARNKLLPSESIKLFNNQLLNDWGLDEINLSITRISV